MITISALEPGFKLPYGPDYMARVGAATARKLCALYAPPAIGHERDAVAPVQPYFYARPLIVQNIAGAYVAASVDISVHDWPAVYGVTVQVTV